MRHQHNDDYYDEDEVYEEDYEGGEEEQGQAREPPKPTKKEKEYLRERERLKGKYRQKLETASALERLKERYRQKLETASALGHSSLGNTPKATSNDKFGSFFRPSSPGIAPPVISYALVNEPSKQMATGSNGRVGEHGNKNMAKKKPVAKRPFDEEDDEAIEIIRKMFKYNPNRWKYEDDSDFEVHFDVIQKDEQLICNLSPLRNGNQLDQKELFASIETAVEPIPPVEQHHQPVPEPQLRRSARTAKPSKALQGFEVDFKKRTKKEGTVARKSKAVQAALNEVGLSRTPQYHKKVRPSPLSEHHQPVAEPHLRRSTRLTKPTKALQDFQMDFGKRKKKEKTDTGKKTIEEILKEAGLE